MTQVEQLLEASSVPGGVACWGDRDSVTATVAFGVTREAGPQVSADTRYDLASLTKVVATLPAIMRLVATGDLDLDAPLKDWFPAAGSGQTPSLGDVTARQLLAHNAGLPAFSRVHTVTRDRLIALAGTLQATLERQPGGLAVYSDTGFMLLGALVERISGQRLDQFVQEQVLTPLGMMDTHFNPTERPPLSADYAATEHCGWRNRLLIGEVHDENCFAWEGVAGHAGLFGTAFDLSLFARAWLNQAEQLGSLAWQAATVASHARTESGEVRGLGWVLAPAGFAAARDGFGHTGFTGTSLWINPVAGKFAVLLTNRVHPDRNRPTGILELRAAYHRLVL